MLDSLPDTETLDWVRETVGPFELLSQFEHSHGYSKLWRLEAANEFFWVKMHAHPHKWAGEVHALTKWAPSVGLAPDLVAFKDDPRAVILSEVRGRSAEEVQYEDGAEEKMWSAAGEWLARMHQRENDWFGNVTQTGQPHGQPETDALGVARLMYENRIEKGRQQGILSTHEYDRVTGMIRDTVACLEGEKARSLHRDFTPRNWMSEPDGILTAIIDFEHARWDVRALDLCRPWDWDFRRNPRLIDAFYEGYGGLSDKLRAQIEFYRLAMAACGTVWAIEVGDQAFSDHNRDSLHRLIGAAPA